MVTERKETKQMQSTFEKLGGTYRLEGDYLLPNVEVPESPAIGIWGQRRRKHLMEHNHALYGFKELDELLCALPLDDNNAVFNLCCSLCTAYERKAFLDGIQYGAQLVLELYK